MWTIAGTHAFTNHSHGNRITHHPFEHRQNRAGFTSSDLCTSLAKHGKPPKKAPLTMGFPVAYVGRHPKPRDLLGKLLYGVGGVLRATGVALDGLGAAVQGPYGVKDEREPQIAHALGVAPVLVRDPRVQAHACRQRAAGCPCCAGGGGVGRAAMGRAARSARRRKRSAALGASICAVRVR
jgi:hypothetical protein